MESPSIGPSTEEPISSVEMIERTFSLSHLKQAKQMISLAMLPQQCLLLDVLHCFGPQCTSSPDPLLAYTHTVPAPTVPEYGCLLYIHHQVVTRHTYSSLCHRKASVVYVQLRHNGEQHRQRDFHFNDFGAVESFCSWTASIVVKLAAGRNGHIGYRSCPSCDTELVQLYRDKVHLLCQGQGSVPCL